MSNPGTSGTQGSAPDASTTPAQDAAALPAPGGGGHPGKGCGLGTSCTPGGDLLAPAAADGFQIVTPPGTYAVEPAQEIFPQYCATLPNTAEFDVGTVQSWMTPGSSHELIVYQGGTPAPGSTAACSLGTDKWLYEASIAGEIVELKMPNGVGYRLPAGTQIILTIHFINVGTSTEHPQVKVNLLGTRNLQYTAGSMVSFNTTIDVPAASPRGPGTQTVMGMCTVPAGTNFFAIGTHTGGIATAADVNLVSGGTSTNVVHTTDWQNPDVGVWTAPPFLAVHAGDSFTYSCAYSNPGASPVTVGETSSNEQCMAIGYYFPEGTVTCN